MSSFDWKQLSMQVNTGATTFGTIVPSNMHMELKEFCYSNTTNNNNQITIAQIPSGTIRPPSATIIDFEQIAAQSPYSPRIPIRVMQENSVLQAQSSAGPITVTLSYRLLYGRP